MVTRREASPSPASNPKGNGPGQRPRGRWSRSPAGDPEEDGPDCLVANRMLATRKEMVQVPCWRPGGRWSMSPTGDPDSGKPEREGLGFSTENLSILFNGRLFRKTCHLSQKPSTRTFFRSLHA
ncbi:Uncharacterized protein Rs2_21436 [Raphanus sativus]|nr:Uncharacterized protein Rs2_21436 [Raphanus sativus]